MDIVYLVAKTGMDDSLEMVGDRLFSRYDTAVLIARGVSAKPVYIYAMTLLPNEIAGTSDQFKLLLLYRQLDCYYLVAIDAGHFVPVSTTRFNDVKELKEILGNQYRYLDYLIYACTLIKVIEE